MARGTALSTIRSMLKAEIGEYAGTNTVRDAALNVMLSNKQKWLAVEYSWLFLERRWDLAVTAGSQYIALPTATAGDPETLTTAINFDRDVNVDCLFNTRYSPVEQGIGADEYNALNFALGQSSDPIRRWRLATNPNETNNANKIEVWPVPVNAQTLRFTGQRTLLALVADSDTADLDDLLLVLFCAADILSRGKQADASMKLQMAQRRLQFLRQSYGPRQEKRTLDGMVETQQKPRLAGMTIIVR